MTEQFAAPQGPEFTQVERGQIIAMYADIKRIMLDRAETGLDDTETDELLKTKVPAEDSIEVGHLPGGALDPANRVETRTVALAMMAGALQTDPEKNPALTELYAEAVLAESTRDKFATAIIARAGNRVSGVDNPDITARREHEAAQRIIGDSSAMERGAVDTLATLAFAAGYALAIKEPAHEFDTAQAESAFTIMLRQSEPDPNAWTAEQSAAYAAHLEDRLS